MRKKFAMYDVPSLEDAKKRKFGETAVLNFTLDAKFKELGKGKTYVMKAYGCQGNLADGEKISGIMDSMGYTEVENDEEADVMFFVTCAIREKAETRIYGELGRLKGLKEKNPNLRIVLCGCMPQEEVTVEKVSNTYTQVDIMFGTHNIHKLPEYLYESYTKNLRVLEVFSKEGEIVEEIPQKRGNPYKAWIDITYGCDEFCTYCIVPYTRGKERSRNPEAIIKEVSALAKAGYKEVTLLGENVNSYGNDFQDRKYTFGNLLTDLAEIGIPRIRFTTSHPKDLDVFTMEVMSRYPNIMPHLHLPVQSGSNKVLKKMNRKYTREIYLEKIEKLKKLVPSISITTDIIVGFPGETEEDFEDTMSLVTEAGFEGAYTFVYSPRTGTPAATFTDQVDPVVSKQRLHRLNEVVNAGFAKGNKRFDGKVVSVLIDGRNEKKEHLLRGYTRHNKIVDLEGPDSLIGKLVQVKITKAQTWNLEGQIID